MPTKAQTKDYFSTYEQWHGAITDKCGITLSRDYCERRISALEDLSDPSTKSFIELYGEVYRDKVIAWFRRASLNS